MKKKHLIYLFGILCLFIAFCKPALLSDTKMAFTFSMEKPNTHYYHVALSCQGFLEETLDFKLPVWTPGYYLIMDYAKNVLNFRAEDGNGNQLEWSKTTKNTWQVKCAKEEVIVVSYDVYAFARSVADSFLDDARAFICPTGVFMHVGGHLDHPVSVTVRPNEALHRISTGLDPVEGQLSTFSASDFDILYDCPILIGNQEILEFEVQRIPHIIAIENLEDFDKEKFAADIKRVCEGAIRPGDRCELSGAVRRLFWSSDSATGGKSCDFER